MGSSSKKRKSAFLVMALATMSLTGCFYMEPVKISVSNDSSVLRSSDSMVWRSDPTRAIFQNRSSHIYVKIWVGREMIGAPDLELAPEESWPFNFPGVGDQIICIAGREATTSGWLDLGTKKRSVRISLFYSSGSIREILVGNGDFSDYHYRPLIKVYQ